jgi:hypothetical protein
MSITITCDYCGEAIDREDSQLVTLQARGDKGGPKRDRWKSGYLAHYHGEPCYTRVFDEILAIHQDELERIPTATPDEIAKWMPGDEGLSPLDFEPLFVIEMMERGDGSLHDLPRERAELVERGLKFRNHFRVFDRGIRTLGDLRRAVNDESLLTVGMIGPKAFAAISEALEAIYAVGSVA